MTEQPPVVGLSAYAVRTAWGVWDTDVVLLPGNSVDVVLVATAWAPDGTVEAAEDPGLPFCVAVQGHPEAEDDPRLFEGLVEAARRTRRVRRAATVAGLRA